MRIHNDEETPAREREQPGRLYFAYGSLLSKDTMLHLCSDAEPYARAVLQDYTRQWRGPLTIVPAAGSSLTGALYQVTPGCERILDRFEGYPDSYSKIDLRVQIEDARGEAETVSAFAYRMNGGHEKRPSNDYLALCIRGAEDWQIDPAELIDTLPEE